MNALRSQDFQNIACQKLRIIGSGFFELLNSGHFLRYGVHIKWRKVYYLRQEVYVFIDISSLICLFASKQDYARTTQPGFTKYGGKGSIWKKDGTVRFSGNLDRVTLGLG